MSKHFKFSQNTKNALTRAIKHFRLNIKPNKVLKIKNNKILKESTTKDVKKLVGNKSLKEYKLEARVPAKM